MLTVISSLRAVLSVVLLVSSVLNRVGFVMRISALRWWLLLCSGVVMHSTVVSLVVVSGDSVGLLVTWSVLSICFSGLFVSGICSLV